MKTLVLLSLGAAAIALGGCYPEVDVANAHDAERPDVRTVARLTCPEQQGDLRRIAAAAGGERCTYTAPNGGEVTVQLVRAGGGDVRPALARIEAELRETVPPPSERARPVAASATNSDVNINLPGFEVRAGEDSARVRLPGVEVDANGEDAWVNIGGRGGEIVQVNARGGVSEVRVNEGEDGVISATYILTREEPTRAGWRTAGYQARGPRTGPLVVATARSRAESDQLLDDVQDLVDRSFEVAEAR